jgi:hypothetical protein
VKRFKKIKILKMSVIFLSVMLMLIFIVTGCSLFTKAAATTQSTEEQVTENSDTSAVSETETTTTVQETETTAAQTEKSKEVESNFGLIGKSADNIEEIFKFIDENIKDATPEFASEMLYSIMKLCEEYKFDFTDKLSNQDVQSEIISLLPSFEQIDLNVLTGSGSQKVKELAQEAIDKKYRLIAVEGFIAPVVDYKAYDIYRPYITQEMKDYIDIKLDESERPSVMDAGIVIPVEDFVDRIIKSMDYAAKYPDSPRTDEVSKFNNGRIFVYLSGIDNNPVFDSSQKILPDKLTEFQNIFTKYQDTEFGKILGSYLDLLGQENYNRTQKVDDFLSNFQ